MTTLVTVLLVIACFIVIVAVLLQPAKGETSAFGGSSQSLFGSTGATSFLFKAAMGGGLFIMVASLYLGWAQVHASRRSVIDLNAPVPAPVGAPQAGQQPAAPGPTGPVSPLSTAPTGETPAPPAAAPAPQAPPAQPSR